MYTRITREREEGEGERKERERGREIGEESERKRDLKNINQRYAQKESKGRIELER